MYIWIVSCYYRLPNIILLWWMIRWPSIGLLPGQRRTRWANGRPTLANMFARIHLNIYTWYKINDTFCIISSDNLPYYGIHNSKTINQCSQISRLWVHTSGLMGRGGSGSREGPAWVRRLDRPPRKSTPLRVHYECPSAKGNRPLSTVNETLNQCRASVCDVGPALIQCWCLRAVDSHWQ